MGCLLSKTSGFLHRLALQHTDTHHGGNSPLAFSKASALVTCSRQLLLIYKWMIGHQETPSRHAASWTLGLPSLEPLQLEGRRGTTGCPPHRRQLLEAAPAPLLTQRGGVWSPGYPWLERGLYSERLCSFLKIRSSINKKRRHKY